MLLPRPWGWDEALPGAAPGPGIRTLEGGVAQTRTCILDLSPAACGPGRVRTPQSRDVPQSPPSDPWEMGVFPAPARPPRMCPCLLHPLGRHCALGRVCSESRRRAPRRARPGSGQTHGGLWTPLLGSTAGLSFPVEAGLGGQGPFGASSLRTWGAAGSLHMSQALKITGEEGHPGAAARHPAHGRNCLQMRLGSRKPAQCSRQPPAARLQGPPPGAAGLGPSPTDAQSPPGDSGSWGPGI